MAAAVDASRNDVYISGDVRIDSGAVIAPGVVIQAAPNTYVAIAAGVCLGMGSIIQAHQGNIEIQQGAMIGAGVLIIGKSTIGENACIGYGSTIFRASIQAAIVVAPNSLLGDISRSGRGVVEQQTPKPPHFRASNQGQTTPPKSPAVKPTEDPWDAPEFSTPEQKPSEPPSVEDSSPDKTEAVTPPESPPENPPEKDEKIAPEIIQTSPEIQEETNQRDLKTPVVGQAYINQLLVTLFPHHPPKSPPSN